LYYGERGGVDLVGLKPNAYIDIPHCKTWVPWYCWLDHLTHQNLSLIWPIECLVVC